MSYELLRYMLNEHSVSACFLMLEYIASPAQSWDALIDQYVVNIPIYNYHH